MKKLKRAEAEECAVTLVCEEDGREESVDLQIDVAHMVVTARTFAPDILDWDRFAEEKLLPELSLIPYHPLYQEGYGDERFLASAKDALRFYRGEDACEIAQKLTLFCPRAYQADPSLKVIDFELRGRQAVLWLGNPDLAAYGGDGWDAAPYEFCAGQVEDRYVEDAVVLNFPADTAVFQAGEAQDECPELEIPGNVSKNELRRGNIPCILYRRDGESCHGIRFDDAIGEVIKEAGVLVSKFEHLA